MLNFDIITREKKFITRWGTALAIVVGWQLVSLRFPSYIFPGLIDLAEITLGIIVSPEIGTFAGHVMDTFRRLLIGYFLSIFLGVALGTVMGRSFVAEKFFRVWVVIGLAIPALVVAFALIMTFGITDWVPIITITIVGTPFIALNMWEGSKNFDENLNEMGDFYGANRFQKFRDILLPQLFKFIFPSLYWGLIVNWKVLFIAEVFGAGSGVGYMVNYWFSQQHVDKMLGWVLMPVVIIILIQMLIRKSENYIINW